MPASNRELEEFDDSNLSDIDLNLLVTLSALLRCKNVTHAGRDVRLSQPATSRALGRLRKMFDDPLLVKSDRSFELSPLARSIEAKLVTVLEDVYDIFNECRTEPDRFALALPDHQALLLTAPLSAYLRQISPSTVFLPLIGHNNVMPRLESGELDLAVGRADDAPPGFFCRTLPVISSRCLVSRDHPALEQRTSFAELGQFLSIRIGTAYQTGFGEVYDGLEAIRPRGRETLTVPDVQTAARLVLDTDAVLILPHCSATLLAERYGLATFVPHRDDIPDYQISLIWHERCHRNSIHAAIRSKIASLITDA
ncbi:LysR family transcriptional regulator [Thalassococcus sp. S3]|uniref:LysR family transcriptional regulator n=1 Tax=Thalassococcus sp. S3 TaxID=2017482 RepID=UPI0013EEA929|nr:LysR substrate-binding domain-containing protein [Thalassococcus sp. S3]